MEKILPFGAHCCGNPVIPKPSSLGKEAYSPEKQTNIVFGDSSDQEETETWWSWTEDGDA